MVFEHRKGQSETRGVGIILCISGVAQRKQGVFQCRREKYYGNEAMLVTKEMKLVTISPGETLCKREKTFLGILLKTKLICSNAKLSRYEANTL